MDLKLLKIQCYKFKSKLKYLCTKFLCFSENRCRRKYFQHFSQYKNSPWVYVKARTHWSVTVSFCQFSDWKLLISCNFASNIGNNNNNRNFQPKLSVQLLPKIHEIRSCQSLNWQKLIVTDQCVVGFAYVWNHPITRKLFQYKVSSGPPVNILIWHGA